MATKGTKQKATKRRASKPRASTKKQAARPPAKKVVRTSLLDAAAAVLAKAKEPMSCLEMIEAVLKAGTWTSGGKTPAATLSAAIHREIKDKGKEARFAKAERGRFRLRAARAGKGGKSA